ncbi:MAG: hypothetical protein JO027_05670 [Solirubrobacterales bacterium]|nr:hypothetical protein [Solirubrobacterales bacterium]
MALLTAVIAAGCGGSGYAKSDFIARADAICAGAVRQTRSISPPSAAQAGSGQDRALSAYLSSVVPVLESEASQLTALRRPPGTRSEQITLTRWYAALAQSVASYKELAAAAKRGDDQAVADAEAALGSSPVDSLAARYGLRSCGTPETTAV